MCMFVLICLLISFLRRRSLVEVTVLWLMNLSRSCSSCVVVPPLFAAALLHLCAPFSSVASSFPMVATVCCCRFCSHTSCECIIVTFCRRSLLRHVLWAGKSIIIEQILLCFFDCCLPTNLQPRCYFTCLSFFVVFLLSFLSHAV